jgi:hypothetical protein
MAQEGGPKLPTCPDVLGQLQNGRKLIGKLGGNKCNVWALYGIL